MMINTGTLCRIAEGEGTLHPSDADFQRVSRSASFLEASVARGEVIYGITSGFGPLVAERQDADANQIALIHHLATGAGPPFDRVYVRAGMLARLAVLSRGFSGVSPKVVSTLSQAIGAGLTPWVPRFGSVGASGDLTPLAHIALALCGLGSVRTESGREDSSSALLRAGIPPINPRGRDALALVNGCSFAAGIAAVNSVRVQRIFDVLLHCAAVYFDCMGGSEEAIDATLDFVRPHQGQVEVRKRLANLLADSRHLRPSGDRDGAFQDAYSIRCIPQLFGGAVEAIEHHRLTCEAELNSVSDNPVIDARNGRIVHGGNFYGLHVGLVSDQLRSVCAVLGGWAERAVSRICDPTRNLGLPPYLRGDSGQSGMMGAQVTATALLAELRLLASPMTPNGNPTNGDNQDVVPLGIGSAARTSESIDRLSEVAAILAIGLAQAGEQRYESRGDKAASATMSLISSVRVHSPTLREDRTLSADIERVANAISRGSLLPSTN